MNTESGPGRAPQPWPDGWGPIVVQTSVEVPDAIRIFFDIPSDRKAPKRGDSLTVTSSLYGIRSGIIVSTRRLRKRGVTRIYADMDATALEAAPEER